MATRVAINDIAEADKLAHLLTCDTVYGHPRQELALEEGALLVDGRSIDVPNEPSPSALP